MDVTELQSAFLLHTYNHHPLGAHSKASHDRLPGVWMWRLLQNKHIPIQLGPIFKLPHFSTTHSLNTESFLCDLQKYHIKYFKNSSEFKNSMSVYICLEKACLSWVSKLSQKSLTSQIYFYHKILARLLSTMSFSCVVGAVGKVTALPTVLSAPQLIMWNRVWCSRNMTSSHSQQTLGEALCLPISKMSV